jgi:hypothetical protein
MVKNPLTCGGLEWNSMFNLFDVQGVMLLSFGASQSQEKGEKSCCFVLCSIFSS